MQALRSLALGICVCAIWGTGAQAADLSRSLGVQGRLDTASGAPASGTFDLTARLFTAPTGGTKVYEEAMTGVVVAGGLFDRELGPIPPGVLEGASELWLELQVGTDTLPRRPLRAVAYALVAQQANAALVAADLACSGCVEPSEVSFPYAAAASKGGAATDLDCTGCVGASEIGAASIGATHIQAGSVTADKAAFPWAAAAAAGGPATDLACTGCVSSTELAASLALSGNVTVGGTLAVCTAGAPGCSVGIKDTALTAAGDGWLTARTPAGVRVRNAGDTEYRPLLFGGGTAVGNLEVTGDLAVASASVAGSLQVGGDAGACTGSRAGTVRWSGSALEVCDGAEWIATVGAGSGGSIQVGNDTGACTPSKGGTLRWTGSVIEVCDGASWKAIYDPPRDGKSKLQAAPSCVDILETGYSTGSGVYWVDFNGGSTDDAIQVYCDMITDGGGWTRVLWAGADKAICAIDDDLPGNNSNLISASGPSFGLPWETVDLLFPNGFGGYGELMGKLASNGDWVILRSDSASWNCFAKGDCFNYNQAQRNVEYKVKGGNWEPAANCCCGPSSYCSSPSSMILGIGAYHTGNGTVRSNASCTQTYMGFYSGGQGPAPNQGQWSIQGTAYVRTRKPVTSPLNGQSKGQPGKSCKALLANGFSVGSGLYWIDPNGGATTDAFKVYCDMTTDGGGWTRVLWAAADVAICAVDGGLPGGTANVAYAKGVSAGLPATTVNLLFDNGFAGNGELMGVLANGQRAAFRSSTASYACFATGGCFNYAQVANNVQYRLNGGSWLNAADCCCGPSSYCSTPSSLIIGIGSYHTGNGVTRNNASCTQTYMGFYSGGQGSSQWDQTGTAWVR
ncbi:MAG: hypothetical protein AMXMBFR64_08030 [Myxococcales bacterium]